MPKSQCVDSIERSEGFRRASSEAVGSHDAQRAVLEKELVDGETKVQRLEVEGFVVLPRSTELDAEVSQLEAKFAMMEAE